MYLFIYIWDFKKKLSFTKSLLINWHLIHNIQIINMASLMDERRKAIDRKLLTLHSSHPNKNLPFNRKKDITRLNG